MTTALVIVLLAQTPQLTESVRQHALGCAEKAQDACALLCDRLDLWVLTGPDVTAAAEHSDAVAKAWPKPTRCAAAQQLWRGRAKVALGHFTRAHDEPDAKDDERVICAAGAMLASRALGKRAEAASWAAKFLGALEGNDEVRGHDVAGAKLVATELVKPEKKSRP